MATSKMYTCIELPHIPRNDDGGRAIKEFTVDNLLRGVLRHHTGGRILETTLNDIHTAARRELNLRVARKEGDFLLKKVGAFGKL